MWFLKPLIFSPDSDDGEDITIHRKPRCHKAIRDSDSEEEEEAEENGVGMAEALVLSASSGEEMETVEVEVKRKGGAQKSRRISRHPVNSDESEPEKGGGVNVEEQEVKRELKPKEGKKREKSQRHKEKKERRSKAVEKLKKRERFAETSEVCKASCFVSELWHKLF